MVASGGHVPLLPPLGSGTERAASANSCESDQITVYERTAIFFAKGNNFCDFLFAFLVNAGLSK